MNPIPNAIECMLDGFDFDPLLILRTPMMPYKKWPAVGNEKLNDPLFLLALQTASKSLYQEICKKGFDVARYADKERISLQKYFNRICYRTTPFGLFAAFSVLHWDEKPLMLAGMNKTKVHFLPDFGHALQGITGSGIGKAHAYFSNPTLYCAGGDFRFIADEEPGNNGKKQFNVQAVKQEAWLKILLDDCRKPCSRKKVLGMLQRLQGMDNSEANQALDELVRIKLLMPDSLPRITSVGNPMRKGDALYTKRTLGLLEFEREISTNTQEALYITTERPIREGGVSAAYRKDIMDGLLAGALLNRPAEVQNLSKFREAFNKKFDQGCIPLLHALDPEIGVGYGDLLQDPSGSVLTQEVPAMGGIPQRQIPFQWSTQLTLLINKMGNPGSSHRILLEKKDLDFLLRNDKSIGTKDLPPGISVVFRISNAGQLFLSSAGGVTPLNLLGRFTPFNGDISKAAKRMADRESRMNPDVIFAEIVHISDYHTANIERRTSIREYEIQILNVPGVDERHSLPLSDLWISIMGKEILLWSKSLSKRIIPRLDSAYNHSISDLPAFRLLCDIQYQGLQNIFSFSLGGLIPQLDHYPRVEYKNVILSLEEWQITPGEWEAFVSGAGTTADVAAWVRQKSLPRHFAVTQGDRQIIIDSERASDLQLLSGLFKSSIPSKIIIKEFPFAENATEYAARDEYGNLFVAEYIAHIFNKGTVYGNKLPLPEFLPTPASEPVSFPLSEWVYYKIYCHESRSNEIISQAIYPMSLKLAAHVQGWFFIRYMDVQGYHLRLRLHVGQNGLGPILRQVEEYFSPLLKDGIVSNISIHPYQREMGRYGGDMAMAEKFFCMDSQLSAAYICRTGLSPEDPYYYSIVLNSMDALTTALCWDLDEKLIFHQRMYERFRDEQGQPQEIYREMQKVFRHFGEERDLFSENKYLGLVRPELESFRSEIKKGQFNGGRDPDFVSSLVHMQANRILVSDFRRQEMVLHYLMWKNYVSMAKINAKSPKKV